MLCYIQLDTISYSCIKLALPGLYWRKYDSQYAKAIWLSALLVTMFTCFLFMLLIILFLKNKMGYANMLQSWVDKYIHISAHLCNISASAIKKNLYRSTFSFIGLVQHEGEYMTLLIFEWTNNLISSCYICHPYWHYGVFSLVILALLALCTSYSMKVLYM